MPPEYAQSERRVLNNQGVEVQHVDAEKNAEQRAEQRKNDQALQQRQQHDNFLLTTYTSTKDIERLRDERLDQLDGQIKAASAYIETLDARLKTLQARALLFKPYNKKPDARRMPDDLAEQLVRASNDLRTQHKAMDKRLQEQTEVRTQFEADISRYRELTATRIAQLTAGVAEAPAAAIGGREALDHLELHLHDGHDHQLRNALAGLHRVGAGAAIPAGHHQRALVVGIDQADQVAEHQPVLMAESGARQDHRRQARIGDVDRQSRGNKLRAPGLEQRAARRCRRAGRVPPSRRWRRPGAEIRRPSAHPGSAPAGGGAPVCP